MAEPHAQSRSDDAPHAVSLDADSLRAALLDTVRTHGYERREQPFALSSGGTSYDYVDMRRAVSRGRDLLLAGEAVLATLNERGWDFDAIGGMTMGADPVAHAVAVLSGRSWYSVRKQEKGYGRQQRIEGATLSSASRCLVFEDTVSTGRSLLEALDAVSTTGATVVGAMTLLDRGDGARAELARRGVAYVPLLTYDDLGIESLGGPTPTTTS